VTARDDDDDDDDDDVHDDRAAATGPGPEEAKRKLTQSARPTSSHHSR
jgi:hypothetical protein